MTHDPTRMTLAPGSTRGYFVKSVVEMLAKNGVSVVCAGGAARDAWHYQPSKDFDFVIIGACTSQSMLSAILAACGVSEVEEFPDYPEGVGDVLWVTKAKHMGVQMDFIMPMAQCDCAEDAVKTFDTTLNAAWFEILPDGTVECCTLPGKYPDLMDDIAVRLMYPEACTQSRIDYLKSKYPQYRYDIKPEELKEEPQCAGN